MDPIAGAAVFFGLKPVAGAAGKLIERLFGPVADAAGDAIAHPIREWHRNRVERAAAIVSEAADMLAQSGREPQPVPGRILMPLLERGSLEEDDSLRQRWSQLLANAASGAKEHEVQPSYVHILAELSPGEVQLLDWIVEHGGQGNGTFALDPATAAQALTLDTFDLAVMKDNLVRLNLVTRPVGVIPVLGAGDVDCGEYWGPLYVTSLGFAFVTACGKSWPAGGC